MAREDTDSTLGLSKSPVRRKVCCRKSQRYRIFSSSTLDMVEESSISEAGHDLFRHLIKLLNGPCRERDDICRFSIDLRLKDRSNQQNWPIIFVTHSLMSGVSVCPQTRVGFRARKFFGGCSLFSRGLAAVEKILACLEYPPPLTIDHDIRFEPIFRISDYDWWLSRTSTKGGSEIS